MKRHAAPPDYLTTCGPVLAESAAAVCLPSRFEKSPANPTPIQPATGLRSQLGAPLAVRSAARPRRQRMLAIDSPPPPGQGKATLAQQLQHGLAGLALVAIEQTRWEAGGWSCSSRQARRTVPGRCLNH